MPKYYCDYCDTFLTHDSPSVRKTHCTGLRHREGVRQYYQKWLEEQVQKLVDQTTEVYKSGKGPVAAPLIPPPGMMPPIGMPPMGLPPRMPPMMPPGFPGMLPPGTMPPGTMPSVGIPGLRPMAPMPPQWGPNPT
ncbi:U1 small nuclear ribonucleoprotein C [Cichlidogyrus casuarinus]|uniref:U1 small nuclear ribonucleoprotein C n=1 Tax=Cichlidogyrus casuarinus TaxID=1844966 RepID=A0ABD2QL42_9PLAT